MARAMRDRVRKDWVSKRRNVTEVWVLNVRLRLVNLPLGKMENILLLKFTQHEKLKHLLLGTGEAKLIEVLNEVHRIMDFFLIVQ